MSVTVEVASDPRFMRRACEMTMHGQSSKVSVGRMADMEHSPLRCVNLWIEMHDIPTFVSVHLVRHKIGVEHFVKSMRDDLYLPEDAPVADRNTRINHGMFINVHALMHMMHSRLCLKSHRKTVNIMRWVRKRVLEIYPELSNNLVPKCVYRNGICNEHTPCNTGPEKVGTIYARQI